MSITKAVIPAAGLGTRMRPVTHLVAKELLPVVTKPSLYLVLEEALASGLNEIILITSEAKKPSFERLSEFFPKLKFQYVIQKEALGLGHAVGLAEKMVAGNPFIIMLPDIIIDHEKPASAQLIEQFQKKGKSINATEHTPRENLHLYGVYDIAKSDGKLHQAKGVVEKPKAEEATSDLTVVGRYLFTPDLFEILKKTPPGRNNEIQLADAMDTMAKQGNLYAYEFEGTHLDIGNPVGMLRANFYFGKKEHGTDIYKGLID